MLIFTDTNPTENSFNEILSKYILPISIVVASIALVAVIVLFIITRYRVKHEPKVMPTPLHDNSAKILESLGGKDNIISHSLTGSRMSLVLKDYSIVDDNKLNEFGIKSVIRMSNKIILINENDMSNLYKDLFNH